MPARELIVVLLAIVLLPSCSTGLRQVEPRPAVQPVISPSIRPEAPPAPRVVVSARQADIVDVQPGDFEARVIEASRDHAVVVDFWAEWCVPCRALDPVLRRVVGAYGDSVVLAKVDIDDHGETAHEYGVSRLPAVKVFRDGQVVGEFTGKLSEAEVVRILGAAVQRRAHEVAVGAPDIVPPRT